MYAPPLATYVAPPPADKKKQASENGARFLANAGANLLLALIAMLALGALHADWTPAIPALGYWPVLAVVYTVRLLLRPYDVPGK